MNQVFYVIQYRSKSEEDWSDWESIYPDKDELETEEDLHEAIADSLRTLVFHLRSNGQGRYERRVVRAVRTTRIYRTGKFCRRAKEIEEDFYNTEL